MTQTGSNRSRSRGRSGGCSNTILVGPARHQATHSQKQASVRHSHRKHAGQPPPLPGAHLYAACKHAPAPLLVNIVDTVARQAGNHMHLQTAMTAHAGTHPQNRSTPQRLLQCCWPCWRRHPVPCIKQSQMLKVSTNLEPQLHAQPHPL